jgi:hypothetical protein
MTQKFLKTANVLRFAAIFTVLVLSACAGGGGKYSQAALSSGSTSADALTSASIAALPQLGEVFFTGTVQAMSDTSVQIADIAFRTDGQTSWAQNLTVGSPVRVRALELPDSTHYAVDVQSAEGFSSSASSVEFNFRDVVVSMGAASWVIGSRTVLVDANTLIDSGIQAGNMVEVEGRLVNNELLAGKITLEDIGSATPMPEITPTPAGQAAIELTGKLDAIDSTSLQLGGLTFAINSATEIKDNPAVGDIVKVEGTRAADGSLAALEVQLADFNKLPASGVVNAEIKGTVDSMGAALWVIGGFNVAVDANTQLSSSLEVGSFAKAQGTLQADGSLLAREIQPADEMNGGGDSQGGDGQGDQGGQSGEDRQVEFSGTVESISAGLWVIAGKSVIVNAQTEITGSPKVGDYVKVEAFGANGSLTASEIKAKSTQSGDDDGIGEDRTGTPGPGNDDGGDDHGGISSTPEPGDDNGGGHNGGSGGNGGGHD